MTGQALTRYDGPADLTGRLNYSLTLADSTLLPALFRGREANVFYGVEYARMVDIPVLAAITGIHVIDGKPTASAGLMTALVRRAGHKFRIRTTGTVEDGDLRAVATVIREDDPDNPFESVWTLERAIRAKLLKRNPDGSVSATKERSAWDTYLEAMLKARATSEVCREAAEEALYGIRYTAEELGATVDEEGAVIEGTVIEEAAPTFAGLKAAVDTVARSRDKSDPDVVARVRTWAEERQLADVDVATAITAEDRRRLGLVDGPVTLGLYLDVLLGYVTEQGHALDGTVTATEVTEEQPAQAPSAPATPVEQPAPAPAPTEAPAAPQEPAAEQPTPDGVDRHAPPVADEAITMALEVARLSLAETDVEKLRATYREAGVRGLNGIDVLGALGDDDLAALPFTDDVEAIPLGALLIKVGEYVGKHGIAIRDVVEQAFPEPTLDSAGIVDAEEVTDDDADPWAADAEADAAQLGSN